VVAVAETDSFLVPSEFFRSGIYSTVHFEGPVSIQFRLSCDFQALCAPVAVPCLRMQFPNIDGAPHLLYKNAPRSRSSPARFTVMPTSPLRFTSSVKASEGAHTVVARDTARARKFLAGIQPHGPSAHKLRELRVRGGGGVSSHGHAKPARDAQAADDTIDVTDAGLFAPPSLPTSWF
jgi:hypothetical protein